MLSQWHSGKEIQSWGVKDPQMNISKQTKKKEDKSFVFGILKIFIKKYTNFNSCNIGKKNKHQNYYLAST